VLDRGESRGIGLVAARGDSCDRDDAEATAIRAAPRWRDRAHRCLRPPRCPPTRAGPGRQALPGSACHRCFHGRRRRVLPRARMRDIGAEQQLHRAFPAGAVTGRGILGTTCRTNGFIAGFNVRRAGSGHPDMTKPAWRWPPRGSSSGSRCGSASRSCCAGCAKWPGRSRPFVRGVSAVGWPRKAGCRGPETPHLAQPRIEHAGRRSR